jgi:membrane associated rhomboid family serine protease
VYLFFANYSDLAMLQHLYETTTNNMAATQFYETINSIKDSYAALGASGAGYGLIMGAALLFPNTTLYFYFTIPVKLKWLALLMGINELSAAMQATPGDNVAHLVHLGGMLFSFILIMIWKRDRKNFY